MLETGVDSIFHLTITDNNHTKANAKYPHCIWLSPTLHLPGISLIWRNTKSIFYDWYCFTHWSCYKKN